MEEYIGLLKENALFAGIGREDIGKMLTCLRARKALYREKEAVFLSGERVTHAGIVLEGEVHVVQEDYFGGRSIIAPVRQNQIFGEAFICAGIQELPVSVFAARDSCILLLGRAKLLDVCPDTCAYHQRFIFNLLKATAQKNIQLNRKIECLSKRTTREKLLAYLSGIVREERNVNPVDSRGIFHIPFNRQELADYLCVDRSAMSTELGKLRDEGIIEYHKECFRFIDQEI